jgi:N-acetylmuramoyl-L-alanine amidase
MMGKGRLRTALHSTASRRLADFRALPLSWLLAVLAAVFLCLPSLAGAACELMSARLGVTPARTRLVLDLSRSGFAYRCAAAGDTALVLELPGMKRAAGFHAPARPGGLFRSLRLRDRGHDGLEVRISLVAPATAKAFRVDAENGKPARLVIDLVAERGVRPASAPKPPVAPSARSPEAPPVSEPTAPSVTPPVTGPAARSAASLVTEPAARSAAPPAAPPIAEQMGSSAQTGTDAAMSLKSATGDASSGPQRRGPRVVVVDPGHGGADPGAVGKGLREKDVCLDVAKRLAAALNKMPGYRAVISRQDDRRVPLAERMRFAEREGADLFISIHVNAAPSSRASGAEVFFLSIGAATDRAAAELARLENEADPDFVVQEDEALRGLPFAVDLRQADTLLRSSRIAEVVLDVLTARGLAESRGVKQAGFAVLKSFQVPSILVEIGFISSPAERKKLKSPDQRQRLAEALACGVGRYFDRFAPARTAP